MSGQIWLAKKMNFLMRPCWDSDATMHVWQNLYMHGVKTDMNTCGPYGYAEHLSAVVWPGAMLH
jgi:hypothetical protein